MNEKRQGQGEVGREDGEHSVEQELTEMDDPIAGSPDREPGADDPRQRPITDNKAGG
jgi:hypothetical protein